ncbi:MAG: alpha/beta hydrolase [Nocardioides sp.]|nr:alpha/beta hydrolase [Nocardioides sp.]
MTAAVDLPGPWRHQRVAANGARFHVAVCEPEHRPPPTPGHGPRPAPLVLLLHGFPQFWWSWRHQLPALAAAGYRVAALDMRGYGGSDKTPDGYDPTTLAADVAGVVKALGAPDAVLVGHGWGGYVAWATAALRPAQVSALATVAAPHPTLMFRGLRRPAGRRALAHLLRMQVPFLPERRLADPTSGMLAEHLVAWSATSYPDSATLSTYQEALALWPSSHCALEYHRWLARSRLRADGRAFRDALRRPVDVPVLEVYGGRDPAVPVPRDGSLDRILTGPHTRVTIPGAGHFVPEEAPEETTAALRGWLSSL